jgi:hypothetical protein
VLNDAHRLADFTLPRGTFKRFDLEQVVRLLIDVLHGLAVLHEVEVDGRPFVHGQVSPLSIYVDEHGTARLVPLPNAPKPDELGYLAPELLQGAGDPRADVFSVGVMLWEALAGKRLFPKGTAAYRSELSLPTIELAPDARWAAPLCELARRAIALDPERRFSNARELCDALSAGAAMRLANVKADAWQEEAPTPVFQPRLHLQPLRRTTPPPSVVSLAPEPLPSMIPSEERPTATRRRARSLWVGAGVALTMAAAFALARVPIRWPPAFPSPHGTFAAALKGRRAPAAAAAPAVMVKSTAPEHAAPPPSIVVAKAPASAVSSAVSAVAPSLSATGSAAVGSAPGPAEAVASARNPATGVRPKIAAPRGPDYGL